MSSLVLYSTVVGGFYKQTDALEKAISTARSAAGDDVWKRGYSAADAAGATAIAKKELNQAGIDPVLLQGQLEYVKFAENKDASGNVYPKLQVGIKAEDQQMLVSLDLKGDVAQRLLAKLDNCKLGDQVKISAWPTTVDKEGRTFINHALSMKDGNGTEIPVNPAISAELKKQTDGVETALKSVGIDDKKAINAAKTTKRIAVNKELLQKLEARLKNEAS